MNNRYIHDEIGNLLSVGSVYGKAFPYRPGVAQRVPGS